MKLSLEEIEKAAFQICSGAGSTSPLEFQRGFLLGVNWYITLSENKNIMDEFKAETLDEEAE